MKRLFRIFSLYSFNEGIVLGYALVVDFFHKQIPKHLFLTKNFYDQLIKKGAHISRNNDSLFVDLDKQNYVLRMKGSDFEVFNQIIVSKELAFVADQIRRLNISNLRIMDCGANIGLSTLFFKSHFPESEIIAIEPDGENFKQLCANIKLNELANITPINIGVWYKSDLLSPNLSFRDGANWSFALRKAEDPSEASIRVDSLENIAKQNNWDRIDVLKIDIEGSEFDLFRNVNSSQRILDSVKIISIEIHEEIGSRYEIEAILVKQGFTIYRSGELSIGVRL